MMGGLRVFLLFAFLSSCMAAKFAMFPMPFGRSHFLFVSKLGLELSARGHEVKIYVGLSSRSFSESPLTQFFNDTKSSSKLTKHTSRGSKYEASTNPRIMLATLYDMQSSYCDEMLADSQLMEEVSHVDLVVGEFIYLCSALVADRFSLPHVLLSPGPLNLPMAFAVNLPSSPSYSSQFGNSVLNTQWSLFDRATNLLYWAFAYFSYSHDLCASFGHVKAKHNIKPEKSIQETLSKVDMVISQVPFGFGLEDPRSVYPNTRVVGPFLPSPAKPLSDELEQFMQGSGDEGVILVSFGSVVGYNFGVDERILQVMAEAFSKLPQKVIWKLKLDDTSKISLSDNVKLISWLPQNDILGHNKTRLFIAHAGINGLLESIYHGIPMICSPFFGDQFSNALMAQKSGFAEAITLGTISSQELIDVIRKVINTPSRYRETARRISKSIKLLPRQPVKEAADWVEYTQAQGGLEFLRPRALDMSFYQLYNLDILLLVSSVLSVILYIAYIFLKVVVKRLFKSSKKQKTK
ncbi:2-hydroxyacylsphingosine 1-beta-galactosyltransferase-like isoform X1 [Acropora palmata]|uniref:2-hydroxyacylsphingosine 1-beta-galactosyltransferase-like isoform X1 n=1 Tax=Acropora palmata TaxID=6131 RepID=UPI003DA0FDA3